LITTSPAANAYGLALSSNGLYLFVAGYNSGTVGEYDATTGAVINANFITGLSYPTGLAVVGNTLYVTSAQVGSASNASLLSTYNATTGAVINANFITGLPSGAQFIAVASVPEPSPSSMIGVGGVALLGIMLRKKHRIA
jgi:WD40 repeat protein